MHELNKYAKPKGVYNQMNRKNKEDMRPQDRIQIKNFKYRENKKLNSLSNIGSNRNFADNVVGLENMCYTHPFVQSVIHNADTGPSAILYIPEQIKDIKRFCIKDGQVLSFDKTFNFRDLHVTASIFKHLGVRQNRTGGNPIIIGPVFLHGNSSYLGYLSFFNHLSAILTDGLSPEDQNIIIGSDDEKALRKAIKQAFPNATQLLCTRHLRNNVLRYLTDKVPTARNDTVNYIRKTIWKIGTMFCRNRRRISRKLYRYASLY